MRSASGGEWIGAAWIGLCLAGLAGCAGLTLMQDTISKFDQSAHTIANGEVAFLRQVQSADCANQFYAAAFQFSIKQSDHLDLTGNCTPTLLDDDMIKRRQALIDAVTLYVDKIQALSGSDRDKTLDDASQKLAGKLQLLAKVHDLASGVQASEGVEGAVVAITGMALDERRFEDIRGAAQAMAPHVAQLVATLKIENTTFAIGIASKVDALQVQLRPALLKARQDAGARSFLDVVAAREIVRAANPLGASPVATTGGAADPKADPQNVAKTLNAALDALVNANDALAHAGSGGLTAAVNDAVARGQSLNTLFSSISK
jgi:hypothetical protein